MTVTLRLPVLDIRPRTRGDCATVPRPCPYASCRHHLALEISRGRVVETWPGVELEDIPAELSCSLDVADRGGLTLADVGKILGLSRERVRQIEESAFVSARDARVSALSELADDSVNRTKPVKHPGRSVLMLASAAPEPVEDADDEREGAPRRISAMLFDPDDADHEAAAAVWELFAKDSTARGFDARSVLSKRTTAWRKANATKGPRTMQVGPRRRPGIDDRGRNSRRQGE